MDLKINTNVLSVVRQLALFEVVLGKNLMTATGLSLDDLQHYAVDYMFSTFKNPTGQLEEAFYQEITPGVGGNVEGELVNPSDHAWRREKGFSGMTDSLGRTFLHDPGIDYMSVSLNNNINVIERYFSDAISATLTELTTGGTP